MLCIMGATACARLCIFPCHSCILSCTAPHHNPLNSSNHGSYTHWILFSCSFRSQSLQSSSLVPKTQRPRFWELGQSTLKRCVLWCPEFLGQFFLCECLTLILMGPSAETTLDCSFACFRTTTRPHNTRKNASREDSIPLRTNAVGTGNKVRKYRAHRTRRHRCPPRRRISDHEESIAALLYLH